MKPKGYLGIDPGQSGAAAILDHYGKWGAHLRFSKLTESEIANWFADQNQAWSLLARLEQVHSMPKQGVASAFKFGRSAGLLLGILASCGIPFEYVTAGVWQRKMRCLSKGNKAVTRAAAQRLFSGDIDFRITDHEADALLIAEYCRRTALGLGFG